VCNSWAWHGTQLSRFPPQQCLGRADFSGIRHGDMNWLLCLGMHRKLGISGISHHFSSLNLILSASWWTSGVRKIAWSGTLLPEASTCWEMRKIVEKLETYDKSDSWLCWWLRQCKTWWCSPVPSNHSHAIFMEVKLGSPLRKSCTKNSSALPFIVVDRMEFLLCLRCDGTPERRMRILSVRYWELHHVMLSWHTQWRSSWW